METECCMDTLASKLYSAYSEKVGGVAFNGDPLPTWEEFKANPEKEKQVIGWMQVALEAKAILTGKVCESVESNGQTTCLDAA